MTSKWEKALGGYSVVYEEYSLYSGPSKKLYIFMDGDARIFSISTKAIVEVKDGGFQSFVKLPFLDRCSLLGYAKERIRKDARRIIKEGL